MTKIEIASYAAQVRTSEKTNAALTPLTTLYPGASAEDAYRVQLAAARQKKTEGIDTIGWKIAYASAATRAACNICEPAYGRIYADCVTDGAKVILPPGRTCKLEPEVIVQLGCDLRGPVTPAKAVAATEKISAGFEFVIPKLAGSMPVSLTDEIAENMSFGLMVVGSSASGQYVDTLPEAQVAFYEGETLLSFAPTKVVMESGPLASVVWLANRLAQQGLWLKKGDRILTASPVKPHYVQPGACYRATFGDWGEVSFLGLVKE